MDLDAISDDELLSVDNVQLSRKMSSLQLCMGNKDYFRKRREDLVLEIYLSFFEGNASPNIGYM